MKQLSFLEAEEAANRLLESLEELSQTAESSRAASASLDQTADTIQAAAKSLQEAVAGLNTLNSIVQRTGTRDFFENIQQLTRDIDQFREALGGTVQEIRSANQELTAGFQDDRERETTWLRTQLDQWKQEILDKTRQLNEESALVFRQSAQSISREVYQQQNVTRTVRTIAVLGVILGIAAVITAIVWR